MAKHKRDKPIYWCPECNMLAYRVQAEAEAKAAGWKNKRVDLCPHREGWHIR